MGAVKLTTTIEESWLQAFKAQAKKDGMSVGQWLAECGKANLPAAVAKSLPDATPRGFPKGRKRRKA